MKIDICTHIEYGMNLKRFTNFSRVYLYSKIFASIFYDISSLFLFMLLAKLH